MDQSVIIKFENGHPDWTSFWAFAKVLEKAIAEAELGEYDGHELELGGSEGTLFCYGPDADRLFSLIRPLVPRHSDFDRLTLSAKDGQGLWGH